MQGMHLHILNPAAHSNIYYILYDSIYIVYVKRKKEKKLPKRHEPMMRLRMTGGPLRGHALTQPEWQAGNWTYVITSLTS